MILGFTFAQIAALLTILVALSTLFPRVRRGFKYAWIRSFGRTSHLLENHIAVEDLTLARIEAELHPNGGSSLRDKLNSIADKQFDFEAHLNASLNVHEVALFRTNASGGVIASNRAHQILTGFNLTQLAGDGWINVICPEDRHNVFEKWKEAVNAGIEFSENICYQKPDGKKYAVHVTVYRERCSAGKIRGYVGVVIPESTDPAITG
jgi:PAS domain S-box-containing protein